MRNFKTKKMKTGNIFYLMGILCIILINVIAWKSQSFCDAYVKNIFPIWGMTYGRITSLFPFSVGEFMLYGAVVLTALGIMLFLVTRISRLRHGKVFRFYKYYRKTYAWVLWCVLWVMTLNCFILYHTTGFEAKYEPSALAFLTITEELEVAFNEEITSDMFQQPKMTSADRPSDADGRPVYTYGELAILRDYIVERCNHLAYQMERDENGAIVYQGDIKEASVEAMRKLGNVYEQLDGFYVKPKNFTCSDFFSQQYIMGYYFPFSMEANINDIMYITNMPPAICHELAHTKGFIYEDDANMIGYLACINADDPFVAYCGYLSVLNYVNSDFFESLGKSQSKYRKHVRIDPLVCEDNIFLTDDAWKEVEQKAVVSTKVVNKVSNDFTNATLKLNGVEQGMMQYSEVVDQLLHYYDGLLY